MTEFARGARVRIVDPELSTSGMVGTVKRVPGDIVSPEISLWPCQTYGVLLDGDSIMTAGLLAEELEAVE